MTFFSLILAPNRNIKKTETKKTNIKPQQPVMKQYYFGQGRFWYFAK